MMNEAGGDSKAGQARWGNDRLPRAKLRSPDTHAAFVPAQLRCAGRPHTQTESVSLLLQGEHPVLQKDEAPGDTVSQQESPGLAFGSPQADECRSRKENGIPLLCELSKTRSARCYFFFFGGTTASLNALARRNFTTVLAGILIGSPV